MNAILVRNDNGYYQKTSAEEENWDDVARDAQVQKIEDLVGWGDYTASYKVIDETGYEATYFVAE